MKIKCVKERLSEATTVYLVSDMSQVALCDTLSSEMLKYVQEKLSQKKKRWIQLNLYSHMLYFCLVSDEHDQDTRNEAYRKNGDLIQQNLAEEKLKNLTVVDKCGKDAVNAFIEGVALGAYRFSSYQTTPQDPVLEDILVVSDALSCDDIERLNILIDAVYQVRDMVNEPVSALNTARLAQRIVEMGQHAHVQVNIMGKEAIQENMMGGLLAVNKGSIDPPAMAVMEYHPHNTTNDRPVALIGKGIVFDTGGLNLKPGQFMDHMKSDMGGAATVAGVVYAAAKAQLPLWIVAYLPITDNRPNGNAYAPGDIVTMHDGSTVEIGNTDAEGRMILADALSYAKKINPVLTLSVATLTGSAAMTAGNQGVVAMHREAAPAMERLKQLGFKTFERVVELPLWEEYEEQLKSEIADRKNVGGREAGAITAGLFLEHFAAKPFIHLDIAGVAFAEKRLGYRGQGATGFGVRLLFEFLNNMAAGM